MANNIPEIKLDLTQIALEAVKQYGLVVAGTIVFCFFVAVLVTLYFYKHPEKFQKLLSFILKYCVGFGIGIKKAYIKADVEGRINDFIKKIRPLVYGYEEVGIKIQWANIGQREDSFFENEELVIVMRDTGIQNQNFVRASMTIITKTILPKTRRYLSKSQCESVDIFIAKKLFEKEKPQAMDYFFQEFFQKKITQNDKIAELVEKYHLMDNAGIFFPVFIQELNFLGEKVFWHKQTSEIMEEVTNFAEFLKNYTFRETGTEKIPLVYEGKFCRCGIVIIGKIGNVTIGNTRIYSNYIRKLREKKIETFYLMGSDNSRSSDFVEGVITGLEGSGVEKYKSTNYTASINSHGKTIKFPAMLTVMRSTEIIRYYDESYHKGFISQARTTPSEPVEPIS